MTFQRYWKQLGPVIGIVLAVVNVLGPKWPPGYIVAAVLSAITNAVTPANMSPIPLTPPPLPAPTPPTTYRPYDQEEPPV